MKKRISLITIASMFVAPVALFAGSDSGTSTAAFLRMEQGARALGMGGASVATVNEVESVWWNPAGLATLETVQVNAAYSTLLEDMSNSYAAFAIPLGNDQSSSLIGSINYFNMGTVDAWDASNRQQPSINPYGLAISAGYAFQWRRNISFGFTLKNIQQNLGSDKGSGFALDGGVIMPVMKDTTFGLSIQNLGPKMKTADYENQLPRTIRAGVGYTIPSRVVFAFDGEKPIDDDLCYHLGAEVMISDAVTLRAGYNTDKAIGFTAGLGLLTSISFEGWGGDRNRNTVRIDYAYVSTGDLDPTHRLSLTFKL